MIVATGGHGLLGRALARGGCRALARAELDVTDADAIARCLDELRPAAVINAAAYTAVDRAEVDRERAFAVNAVAAGKLARACAARSIALVHVSTDYVFDGDSASPIGEHEPVRPRSVYGASKAAGEPLVLAAGGQVVRTAWVFGAGGRGFVHAVARARERMEVAADQRGSPTWVDDLARALIELAGRPAHARPAILHYAGEPAVSRLELAHAVVACLQRPIELVAVDRRDPIRPASSVLSMRRARELGLAPSDWRRGLAALAAELRCASS